MGDAEEAQSLVERARALAAAGRLGDAVSSFDQVIERFRDTSDPGVESAVAEALFAKAQGLQQIERDEQALQVYAQMVERYRRRADFRGPLSRALVHRATTLARLGRVEEAISVWDDLLASFSDVSEPPLAMGVAIAYLSKGAALRRLDRLDAALDAYDELVIRFSDSPFPPLRGRVDAALSEKVFALLLQRNYDEAIVVANAAVERLGRGGDPDALAIAVLNLGGALASEQRLDEAIEVYDLLLDQLDDPSAPALRYRAILAMSNKVEALTALGREDEAGATHEEMLGRYGNEVPLAFADAAARNAHEETAKPVVAGMLLKQALALADLEQTREALVVVENLIGTFAREQGDEFEQVLAVAGELRDQLLRGQ